MSINEETKGEHYPKIDPWLLQAQMKSSGNAEVDGRRCDVLKYAFRMKGGKAKLLEDLKKARHCAEAAIKALENDITEDALRKSVRLSVADAMLGDSSSILTYVGGQA